MIFENIELFFKKNCFFEESFIFYSTCKVWGILEFTSFIYRLSFKNSILFFFICLVEIFCFFYLNCIKYNFIRFIVIN